MARWQGVKALDFCLHTLPSAVVSAALPRGHAALPFVNVGVGFPTQPPLLQLVFSGFMGFTYQHLYNP
jgi:hypothetical protein